MRTPKDLFFVTGEIWGLFVRPGKEQRMKRTPQSSITALLEGVEQAKQKKEFNILKDLKTLHATVWKDTETRLPRAAG